MNYKWLIGKRRGRKFSALFISFYSELGLKDFRIIGCSIIGKYLENHYILVILILTTFNYQL